MIRLTDSAADYIENYLKTYASTAVGVAIKIVRNGCSGFSYKLEIQRNTPDPVQYGLHTHPSNGVKVFIELDTTLPMISGTTLDYVKQGLNEGFEFRNPNVKAECGCGESFTV